MKPDAADAFEQWAVRATSKAPSQRRLCPILYPPCWQCMSNCRCQFWCHLVLQFAADACGVVHEWIAVTHVNTSDFRFRAQGHGSLRRCSPGF
jgi:hypothetical protein